MTRVFSVEALLIELGEDAADLIVERHHGVAARAERRLAGVARMMDARYVILVRGVDRGRTASSLFCA